MGNKTYKPGQTSPASAQAGVIGSRGGKTGIERTVVRGEPFPPTLEKGQTYRIIDRTKNNSGKGT